MRPRGIAVDVKAFNVAMAKQKDEARKAWKGSGEAATEGVWFEVKDTFGVTEFLGYDTETAEALVNGLFVKGKPSRHSKPARAARSSSIRPRSTANPAARSATRALSKGRMARCSASPTR